MEFLLPSCPSNDPPHVCRDSAQGTHLFTVRLYFQHGHCVFVSLCYKGINGIFGLIFREFDFVFHHRHSGKPSLAGRDSRSVLGTCFLSGDAFLRNAIGIIYAVSLSMQILLTNDDGVYAPGLAAMERALRRLGDVCVVAPAREQSGVSHLITFQTPLIAKKVFVDDEPWGWMVDGSPADCVKLGVTQISPRWPDLVVSGINGGLNAGINVLYSGTVAAAMEGAFYGVTSVAVSVEYDENEPFHQAAKLAVEVIERILQKQGSVGLLYNMNIPLASLRTEQPKVKVAEMDVRQYWESFEKRIDPLGRPYYWLSGRPDLQQPEVGVSDRQTDLTALSEGFITLTPLEYDMTHRAQLAAMESWNLDPPNSVLPSIGGKQGPSIRTRHET